ncbi:MAG TPA: M23 family metallopeptidase [Candidatus Peribacteraceae bacterium]|nr:M23 family metallopeptidase [Candidatus Peribacteraceae bacterium]
MNKIPAVILAVVVTTGCTTALHEPLPETARRETPLSFGLYVTSDRAQNPIDPPERFYGYHAAVDYEVSEEELHAEVPVYALCVGKILQSGSVEGYGGLVVHTCRLNGKDVTVLYGHLSTDNLPPVGSRLTPGERIGILAEARSADSGHNRKHLHFGIHKGKELSILGYVQDEEKLQEFINPVSIVPTSALSEVLSLHEAYWRQSAKSSATSAVGAQ